MKKTPLTKEELEECARLKQIYSSKKKELNLSHEKLGDAIGISQSAVSHYLNQVNALNLPIALKLASALGVAIADFSPRLATEVSGMPEHQSGGLSELKQYFGQFSSGTKEPATAPIMTTAKLSSSSPIMLTEQTSEAVGGDGFALEITDTSMESVSGTDSFFPLDIVVCKKTTKASPGSFVAAKVEGSETLIFRKYRDRGINASGNHEFELVPLNPDYPTLAISAPHQGEIVGVMVEHRKRYF